MRSLIVCFVCIVLFASVSQAKEYTIESRYIAIPGATINKPGSYNNPYVIKNEAGQEVASIHPQYFTVEGADILSPGSESNPMVIDTNDDLLEEAE